MPISAIDGCDEGHWAEVLGIITDAANTAGFEARLVSQSEEVGVIQKNIIQNLYQNEIIVCDVSGKNANVMFELGMRLAFDKPTIIIKDDKTSYSFDTSPVEHINYPRDLRFGRIVTFKSILVEKLKATMKAAQNQTDYSPFLKHFGDFTVAKIDTREVGAQEFVLAELSSINQSLSILTRRNLNNENFDNKIVGRNVDFVTAEIDNDKELQQLLQMLFNVEGVLNVDFTQNGMHKRFEISYESGSESKVDASRSRAKKAFETFVVNKQRRAAQKSQIN
jgi:hypothetical protein